MKLESFSFRDRFDILLENRLRGVAEHLQMGNPRLVCELRFFRVGVIIGDFGVRERV